MNPLNSPDYALRNRATHHGEQPISSVTNLQATLDGLAVGASFTEPNLADLPSTPNASGDTQFAEVYDDSVDDDNNGRYFRENGDTAWTKVPGDLTGRVIALEDEVEALDAQVFDLESIGRATVGSGPLTTSGSTRIDAAKFPAAGTLKSVEVNASAATAAVLKIVSPNGFNYDVEYSIPVSLATGVTVLTAQDFGLVEVQPGWHFGFYTAGGLKYTAGVTGNSLFIAGEANGTNVALTFATPLMDMKATIAVSTIAPLTENVATINDDLEADVVTGRGNITTGPSLTSTNSTRIEGVAFAKQGYVKSVTVRASKAINGKLVFVRSAGVGLYDVIHSYNVNLFLGINTLVAGVDYPETLVLVGDRFGLYTPAGGIYYTTSAAGSSFNYTGGEATGTGVAFGSSTVLLDWAATAELRVVPDLEARMDAVEADLVVLPDLEALIPVVDQINDELSDDVISGRSDITTGSLAWTTNTTRFEGSFFPSGGYVTSVRIRASKVIAGKLIFARPVGVGVFDVIHSYSVTLAIGINTLVAGVHYPATQVLPGDTFGLYAPAGGVYSNSGPLGSSYHYTSGEAVGNGVSAPRASILLDWAATVEVRLVPEILERLDTLEAPEVATTPVISSTRFRNENPLTLRSGNPAWTITIDGLDSPTSGLQSHIYLPFYTYMDQTEVVLRFVILDSSARLGIVRKPMAIDLDVGTYAELDVATGKIGIYLWDGLTTFDLSTEIAVGFSLVVGQEYQLRLVKDGYNNTLFFTDVKSNVSVSVTSISSSPNRVRQWGEPGVVYRQGSARLTKFAYLVAQREPFALCVGDSITEGNSLGNDWELRWASLLRNELPNEEIAISARGGANFADILLRGDIRSVYPKWVIILCGTNDRLAAGGVAAWATSMQTFISIMVANGARPIICCIPPNGNGGMTFITDANAMITSRAFGDYPAVRWDRALSTNNDLLVLNPALEIGDGTHPNVAGHAVMLDRLQFDVPELFIT